MKLLKKYRYELFALLLTVGLLKGVFYFASVDITEKASLSACFAFLIADAILLYFTLRKLWKTKWKKQLLQAAQKIISKIAKALMTFIEKRTGGKKTTVLAGKTTISFDLPLQNQEKQKTPKAPKWKRLKTDREKLGYLYKHMIEHRINHGCKILSSETPTEIKKHGENEVFEEHIFSLYIDNRYQQTPKTDSETLEQLKKELDKR